mgnify:CR=1 FL=1
MSVNHIEPLPGQQLSYRHRPGGSRTGQRMNSNSQGLKLGHQGILIGVDVGDRILEATPIAAADLGEQQLLHAPQAQPAPDQQHPHQALAVVVLTRLCHALAKAHQNGQSALKLISLKPAASNIDVISAFE